MSSEEPLRQGARKKRRGGDLDSVPSGDAQFHLFTPNTSSEAMCGESCE